MGRPILHEDGETSPAEAQNGADGPPADSPISEEEEGEVDQSGESFGSRVEMYRRSLGLGLAMGAPAVSESGDELGEDYWESICRREWGVLRPSDSCSWEQTCEKILTGSLPPDQPLPHSG